MNNLLTATFVASTLSTTAIAGISITGNYEGTFTDGNPGASSYAQDLDLTLKGNVTDGTSVTVTFEDLTGGSTVTSTQLFLETRIEGLNFKGGNYKSQNGTGLMQSEGAVTNQFELGTNIAGFGISVGQTSGDSNSAADVTGSIAGIDITVQNITNDTRYISAATSVSGLDIIVEAQETTSTTTNTGVSISTTVAGMTVTGVAIDVEDTTGITQDDGILGDISNAVNGKTVTGIVASTDTVLGTVTGKYIVKNDDTTYVGKLKRGIMEYGYSKTENTDGVFDAVLSVSF
jgi:hypothetical protein